MGSLWFPKSLFLGSNTIIYSFINWRFFYHRGVLGPFIKCKYSDFFSLHSVSEESQRRHIIIYHCSECYMLYEYLLTCSQFFSFFCNILLNRCITNIWLNFIRGSFKWVAIDHHAAPLSFEQSRNLYVSLINTSKEEVLRGFLSIQTNLTFHCLSSRKKTIQHLQNYISIIYSK